MQFAAAILLIVFVFCSGHAQAADSSDLQHLIDMLSSDDFETREKASAKLERRGPEIWGQLQKLTESKDAEVQMRARSAMRELTRRALDEARKELEQQIRTGEGVQKEFKRKLETASRETLDVYRKTYAARTELEKSKNPSEELRARGEEAQKTYDAALKIYRFTREKVDWRVDHWPRERRGIEARIRLCEELMLLGELIPPADAVSLKPSALPFKMRLQLEISLELKDVPLAKALKDFTDASGIPIELSPDLNTHELPTITLDIFDAEAEIVMKWICHASDVECTIDKEKHKIIIQKK